jgi:hypothetical protein
MAYIPDCRLFPFVEVCLSENIPATHDLYKVMGSKMNNADILVSRDKTGLSKTKYVPLPIHGVARLNLEKELRHIGRYLN